MTPPPPPWETALGALGVFERVVRDYQYGVPGMRDQRLNDIASAKQWVRQHRDNQQGERNPQ